MWVTQDGRTHSLALPNPTEVMTPDFVGALDRLTSRHAQALISELMEAEFERTHVWDSLQESQFVEVGPPRNLLSGSPATAEDMIDLVRDVPLRWRLDAVFAVQAYLSS